MKCEFYPLAYEIECHESTFSVLTKFRTKDINLDKDCYGLIQANMTWGLPILTDMADCEVLERFWLSRAHIQWLVDELGEEYSKKLPAYVGLDIFIKFILCPYLSFFAHG